MSFRPLICGWYNTSGGNLPTSSCLICCNLSTIDKTLQRLLVLFVVISRPLKWSWTYIWRVTPLDLLNYSFGVMGPALLHQYHSLLKWNIVISTLSFLTPKAESVDENVESDREQYCKSGLVLYLFIEGKYTIPILSGQVSFIYLLTKTSMM